MRVKTKYGNGTLLGIIENNGLLIYQVLLDNFFNEDLNIEEREFNQTKPINERIYGALNITVLSDDGVEIEFSTEIKILKK